MQFRSHKSFFVVPLALLSVVGIGAFGCGHGSSAVNGPTPDLQVNNSPAVHGVTQPKSVNVAHKADIDSRWNAAVKADTAAAYRGFASAFPADPRTQKATAMAANMDWRHAEKLGTVDGYQAFLSNNPHDIHTAEAARLAKGEDISLADAIRRGWVRSHVTGNGLQTVSLTVRKVVARPIRVSVPAGTYFVSGGGSQNMVAREATSIDLTDSTSADLTVDAACANFYRSQPDDSNSFAVRASHPNAALRRVLAVINRESPEDLVAQLAIWSLTDNPGRDEVDSHISISPSDDDYRQAARILRTAGVPPSSRRMFRGLH